MIDPLFDMFAAAMFICANLKQYSFSFNVLAKLDQHLWNWTIMLIKLIGDGECSLAWFHLIRIFLANEIDHFFKVVTRNRLPFYLGSLVHIISSLFNHFCLLQNVNVQATILKFSVHVFGNAVFIGCSNFFSSLGYLFQLIFAS